MKHFLGLILIFLLLSCSDSETSLSGDTDTDTENQEQGTEAESDTESIENELESDSEQLPDTKVFYTKDGFIRDEKRRAIILRGIAFPSRQVKDWEEQEKDQDKKDMLFIAESGFNAIRLVINWNRIETTPRHYDENYIELVVKHAWLAAKAGLYVFIDMHQDMYGVGFGQNGAPEWTCDKKYYDSFVPANPWFLGYFSSEVKACFDNFWTDTDLQDLQISAAMAIAERLNHNNWVMGFDTFNEPPPGSADMLEFGPKFLWPFHVRFKNAMDKALPGRMIFFEPAVTINVQGDSKIPGPQGKFDAIFAPHYYNTGVETNHEWSGDDAKDRKMVEKVASLAKDMQSPWIFGEMGGDRATTNLTEYLLSLYSIIDEHMGNTSIWVFSKKTKGFGLVDSDTGDWIKHAPGFLRPAPSAIVGTPKSFSWDYDKLTFKLEWKEDTKEGTSEIIIPKWIKDVGYELTIDGKKENPGYNEFGRLEIPAISKDRTLTLITKSGYPE